MITKNIEFKHYQLVTAFHQVAGAIKRDEAAKYELQLWFGVRRIAAAPLFRRFDRDIRE